MTIHEFLNTDELVLLLIFQHYNSRVSAAERTLESFRHRYRDAVSFLRMPCSLKDKFLTEYQVTASPTILGLRRGKVVWRHEGNADEAMLEELAERYLPTAHA
jgi:thioredoxin-like negative regulator of GroEL